MSEPHADPRPDTSAADAEPARTAPQVLADAAAPAADEASDPDGASSDPGSDAEPVDPESIGYRMLDGTDAGAASTEGEPDTAEHTLADQVARTDAALVAWRGEAQRRRELYQEAKARAEAERLAYQRRLMRMAVAAVALAGLGGVAIGYAVHGMRGSDAPTPVEASAARPVTPATPEAPARPAATPSVAAARPEVPVAAPATPVDPDLELVAGSVRLWNEGGHIWASFATPERGSVGFQYLDGAGTPVLEPMGCRSPGADGVRNCAAGRSAARIHEAIADGAAPGTWTIQACGPRGCADLGRFDAATATP